MAEAGDLKSLQCGFESHRSYFRFTWIAQLGLGTSSGSKKKQNSVTPR